MTSYSDVNGDGVLDVVAGERPVGRTDLAPAAPLGSELARVAMLTDAHVVDEESPARLTFLDRTGPPFSSTFRPQEALQPHVVAAAVASIDAARPQAVIEGGDLADSAQANEFDQGLGILRGGVVKTDSGSRGYQGPQAESNADPLFYRPDVDAPRFPGLLAKAELPLRSPGLKAPWYPVLGNHDALVAGELAATPRTNAVATGDRALTKFDPGIDVPRGEEALAPGVVDRLLAHGLPGETEPRTPDPRRRELQAAQAIARLRAASGHGGTGPRLHYAFDVGKDLRVVVLDLTSRTQGSGGTVDAPELAFLRTQLAQPGDRRIIIATHQPLQNAANGDAALALLDKDPRVVAVVSGDTHHNRIAPRKTNAGGYWLIQTSSPADYPQQARALTLVKTKNGKHALVTWMLDPSPKDPLAAISRRLAYLDVQGGRPAREAGRRSDRNAILYLPR